MKLVYIALLLSILLQYGEMAWSSNKTMQNYSPNHQDVIKNPNRPRPRVIRSIPGYYPLPPKLIPSPPIYIPSPPIYVPSPPQFIPSPPVFIPSPPQLIPSPPQFIPSPPLFIPSPPLFVASPPPYIRVIPPKRIPTGCGPAICG